MKPLKKKYPHQIGEETIMSPLWFSGDYNPLLESMDFEIVIKKDDDDYQGDSYVLFADAENGYGCLIFKWGSCSECDALQACKNLADIEELREKLFRSIRWGTASEMLELFKTHDWERDWSRNGETCKEYVEACIQFLKAKA